MDTKNDPRFSTLKASDMGDNLPIGIPENGTLLKGYSLKDLNFPKEKAIGVFRRKHDGEPQTKVVGKTLALLLSQLGGKEFLHEPGDKDVDEAKSLFRISTLYMADVYWLWVAARIDALGNDYEMPFMCQSCRYVGKIVSDLSTMDVVNVSDAAALIQTIPLKKGIEYRDGTIKKSVTITPVLWMHMEGPEMIEAGADEGLMKLHFISKCVTGVEGMEESIVLTDDELNSLKKIDIEILSSAIDKMTIGPSMQVEGDCPNCNTHFYSAVDWSYEGFFSNSSPF